MKRVLLLAFDPEKCERIKKILNTDDQTIQSVLTVDDALHRLTSWSPNYVLMVIDPSFDDEIQNKPKPEILWSEFLHQVRSSSQEYCPVLLITDRFDEEELLKLLNVGVDGYLSNSFNSREMKSALITLDRLKESKDQIRRVTRRMEELNTRDELTGLNTMRSTYRVGEETILRASRRGLSVSAVMLNINGFSGVNQSYGFIIGSRVLQQVAKRLSSIAPASSTLARVGADEFFILLPEVSPEELRRFVKQLRHTIQSSAFKDEKCQITLTASYGVAQIHPSSSHLGMAELLHTTSEALRVARDQGVGAIHEVFPQEKGSGFSTVEA